MLNIHRLRELRKAKGLIQQEVASILGVGRTTYVKYETGDSEPPVESISQLANFFDVSTDYLLGNTDDPTPPNKKKPTPQTVGPALTKVLKEAGYLQNDAPLTDDEADKLLKYLMAIREADSK